VLPLSIRRLAEADMMLAAEWYETRSPGLGTAFLRAVDACFGLIQRYPDGFQVVTKAVRRARLRRFPHAVYYIASQQQITILAVVHSRQDPREWQGRL